MIPWVELAAAKAPDGGALRLMRRGTEFSIRLGTAELMNSRLSGSEEALAGHACERIRDRTRCRVLIGGLGMGFTLRAALASLGPDARVLVAELVPEVVAWARGPMAEIFGTCLDDPRVDIQVGDVGTLIAQAPKSYDAVLLDIDNGPQAITRPANDAIYSTSGLGAAHRTLRPGGVLAVWSAAPDRAFTRRLERTGFAVDEVKVRARGPMGGARHVIWVATRRP